MLRLPRVRRYSMNDFLNSLEAEPSAPFKMICRRTDTIDLGPAMTFAFIDEREGSLQGDYFVVGADTSADAPAAGGLDVDHRLCVPPLLRRINGPGRPRRRRGSCRAPSGQ